MIKHNVWLITLALLRLIGVVLKGTLLNIGTGRTHHSHTDQSLPSWQVCHMNPEAHKGIYI